MSFLFLFQVIQITLSSQIKSCYFKCHTSRKQSDFSSSFVVRVKIVVKVMEDYGIRTSTNDSDLTLIESATEHDCTQIESDTEQDYTQI